MGLTLSALIISLLGVVVMMVPAGQKLREAAAAGDALELRRQVRQKVALRSLRLLGGGLELAGDLRGDLLELRRVLRLQLLKNCLTTGPGPEMVAELLAASPCLLLRLSNCSKPPGPVGGY